MYPLLGLPSGVASGGLPAVVGGTVEGTELPFGLPARVGAVVLAPLGGGVAGWCGMFTKFSRKKTAKPRIAKTMTMPVASNSRDGPRLTGWGGM